MRWIVYGGLGLTLATPEGTRTVEVASAADAREASAGTNGVTVLLAVKSHQIDAAIEDLTAALPASTPVVSVQNGVSNEPTLLRFFDDVQGVCVMMPTGHLEPGVVEQHCSPVPGILDVGLFPAGTDAATEGVAAAFRRAGFVSEPRDDVMAWKHHNLMMNLGNAVQACCAPGRRGRAVRWLVLAEPATRRRHHRDRLPQRRGGAARSHARGAHAGQRPAPEDRPADGCRGQRHGQHRCRDVARRGDLVVPGSPHLQDAEALGAGQPLGRPVLLR